MYVCMYVCIIIINDNINRARARAGVMSADAAGGDGLREEKSHLRIWTTLRYRLFIGSLRGFGFIFQLFVCVFLSLLFKASVCWDEEEQVAPICDFV